ncbi:MAG: hypothetical protein R3C19_02545 [Planctomycetaceae bacterium]
MSERLHGVIFEADEATAADFFCELPPVTFLRLVPLESSGLWAIFTEGWPGDNDVLDDIAIKCSRQFGKVVRYAYDSRVDFFSDLYEHGVLTQSQMPKERGVPLLAKYPFPSNAKEPGLDEQIDSAYRSGYDRALLSTWWRPSS